MFDEGSIAGWSDALGSVEELLDLDSWGGVEGTATASARAVAITDTVGPRLDAFERQSDALTAQLEDIDDETERKQAQSTLAQGDIEAALVALELADLLEDGSVQTASFGGTAPTTPIAGSLASALRTAPAPAPVSPAPTPPEWEPKLRAPLEDIAAKAADGIVKVGRSAATSAVAQQLGLAFTNLVSKAIPDIFAEAKAALSWLKAKAIALLERGLAKITALFGDKVKKALDDWIKNQLDAAPTAIVTALAGVDDTVQAWKSAAANGTAVAALVPQVESMQASKLTTLTWSDRGLKLYGYVAPALLAANLAGIPGSVVAGVIALALAGWMFWSAYDISHDARRLI